MPVWARVALPLALLAVALGLCSATASIEAVIASPYPIAPTPRFHPLLAGRAAIGELPAGAAVELAFRRGETLSDVLEAQGFGSADAQQVVAELRRFANLRRIDTSDRYAAGFAGARPARFALMLEGEGQVVVTRLPDGWEGRWRPYERRTATRNLAGRLTGSLETSIESAGGEPMLAYAMAEVLQWDLDFNRDLREGDRFAVLYEEVFLDGAFHELGEILALRYENAGRLHEAYRAAADQPEGYYDGEGRPLQKMFLRSPLAFSRITSSFSHRRFHPVLKRYRPHYGVDYGAPVGTPVRVTAHGVVASAGWDGGGGRVVKVRHPNGYLTAYLHLSRFASGVRSGLRVRQGDVIGYVGSTGLATGPHLDYRVQRGGHWIDPLSLESAPADPIPAAQLPAFLAWRDELRARLAGEPPPALLAAARPGEAASAGEALGVASADK